MVDGIEVDRTRVNGVKANRYADEGPAVGFKYGSNDGHDVAVAVEGDDVDDGLDDVSIFGLVDGSADG